MKARPEGEAGFTLVEVLIAIALFALIAVAGAALVESILSVRARTEGRLERLGNMQRAMFLVANDLGQVNGGPMVGDAASIRFSRLAGPGGTARPVAYLLTKGTFTRVVSVSTAQPLLANVTAIRWRYLAPGQGWSDHWPADPQRPFAWPAAVSLELELPLAKDPPGGTLRRIVALPAQP